MAVGFEMTPFFHGNAKPIRVGLYVRQDKRHKQVVYWSYWNGRYWGRMRPSMKQALDVKDYASLYQGLPWRGLTEAEYKRQLRKLK